MVWFVFSVLFVVCVAVFCVVCWVVSCVFCVVCYVLCVVYYLLQPDVPVYSIANDSEYGTIFLFLLVSSRLIYGKANSLGVFFMKTNDRQ